MPTILAKAISLITGEEPKQLLKAPKNGVRPLKKMTERDLISLESEIGKTLFGPILPGHRREFFNLDANTWIWHEEWKDDYGQEHSLTTRYEVQEKGILKAQDGTQYSYLDGEELQNFGIAVQMYYEQVMRNVYHRDPATGQKFAQ